MNKLVAWPAGLLLGVTLFLAQTRPAKADDIQIIVCTVPAFACPPGNTFTNEGFFYVPGNLLLANTYTVQPVSLADPRFSDPNQFFDAFSATYVTADVASKWIYLWGEGSLTVSANLGLEALLLGLPALYVDVALRQSYVTTPGLWSFSEGLSGSCDAAAIGNVASTAFQGQVNGANLPAIGGPGDCAVSPFSFVSAPVFDSLGSITQLIGGVAYQFPAGGPAQTITLPFGSEFPDPAINFNNPNNPLNFITNTDIPPGLTQAPNVSPEPSTWVLLSSGFCAAALFRRRRKF